MVTVPTYGVRQVSARPEFQQGVTVQATPGAFGADIGAGLGSLARGVEQASDAMVAMNNLKDSLAAKDSLTGFQRDKMALDYGPNGYMTTQGRAAVDGRDGYTAALEELKSKHGKNLTPGASRAYGVASEAAVTDGMRSGYVHAAQGAKEWAASSSTARMETLRDQALTAWQKPAEVQKSIALGLLEVDNQAALMGWGQDVVDLKKREFTSGVHASVALAMASQPNGASRAMTYLNQNSAAMDTRTRMEMENKLKPYADDEAALSIVNDLMRQTRVAAPAGSVGAAGPTAARANLVTRAAAAGKGKEHIEGLSNDFALNLNAMFEDAPPGIREGLQVGSGYRSEERQGQLWDEAVRKYGSPEAARKWVAPPGNSQHNHGNAVDIWWNGQQLGKAPKHVQDWVHQNASAYGLRFPMPHEPWHVEPVNARGGSTVVPSRDGVSARATMPSYDAAMARINEITDPNVRASAMRQLNAQFEIRSKAEAARSADAKTEMWGMVARGVPVASIPLDLKIAAGREAVQGFSEYETKVGEIKTDPILHRNLTLFAATNPVEFARMDLTAPEIINGVSRSDLKSLVDKQGGVLSDERKAREEGLNITSAMSFARTQLDAVGISTVGLDGAKRQEMALREAQFQMALSDEMEAWRKSNDGKQPQQADIMKMVNRLLLPIVIKTPRDLWIDGSRDGLAFEAGIRADGTTVDVVVKYEDIPIDLRRGIGMDLERELGRKPSEEEIIQRYEDFVLSR